MIKVKNLNNLLPMAKVAGIYVFVYEDSDEGARPFIGLAFEGHYYPLKLQKKMSTHWFEYCQNCTFRKQERCVGGENYLFARQMPAVGLDTPLNKSFYRRSKNRECLRGLIDPDFRPSSSLINTVENVKLPNYLFLVDTHLKDIYWFACNPDITCEADAWQVIPLCISNVWKDSGQMCLGSARDHIDFTDFLSIQEACLNAQFNNDLAIFNTERETIAEHAAEISVGGVQALNKKLRVKNARLADFKRSITKFSTGFDMDSIRIKKPMILPPIYTDFKWDQNNPEQYCFIDTNGSEVVF